MKNRIYAVLLAFLPLLSFSQSVPFPSGNGRDYNAIEPYGYSDTGQGWNTSNYLPFIYNGIWFRMMLPNGVTYNTATKTFTNANPGTTYPLILFFHGRGEVGTDNNKQLTHGGEIHKNAVLSGAFPGFLVYPQSVGNEGGKIVLDKLIAQLPVDFNRIYVHGLSNGGQESWKFTIANPTYVAAAFPMSAADLNATTNENLLYTPIRESQGGLDTNPSPAYGQQVKDWFDAHGGHLEYFFLPTLGHGTWNTMYNMADFFPWFLQQKKNKIMVRFDRNLICPGESASVIMGFTPGFQAYEWRKDGVLIAGATQSKITATTFGSYTGRLRNRNVWTEWSDPVVVGQRPASVTPAILTNGSSLYIPDINGTSAVKLSLPDGYQTYKWNKQGDAQPVGSTQLVTITSPGTYTGTITEFGGCVNVPSIPSPSVTVIDATGAAPNVPKNLQAGGVSLTSINLTWEDDPNPTLNEIGFEIYRADQSAGPYSLVGTVGVDVLSFLNTGLTQNVTYWYKVRSISASGASAGTAAVSGVSQVDTTPPTPPNGVTATNLGSGTVNSPYGIRLNWAAGASTDNVGVTAYEIYQREYPSENWQKAYTIPPSTATTQFTISNLPNGTYFSWVVKARDAAGNLSGPSTEWGRNTGYPNTYTTGVVAKYYKTTSAAPWNSLPNFDAVTVTNTANLTGFALTIPSGQPQDYFGFRFDAALMIQSAGNYTFYSQSDEGSRIYVNGQLVVSNDGLHTSLEKSGTIALTPGYYPIRVEYFDKTGTQSLTVRWEATALGIAKGTIPTTSLFRDYNQVAGKTPLPGTPGTPTNMAATATSYNSINVSWVYAGHTANIELHRSTNGSTYTLLTTLPSGTTSYANTGLNPSTRYYYKTRAVNMTKGDQAMSSAVNAITQALPALPPAPTLLVASGVTANSVTLNWKDNANNETNYDIYKSSGDNTGYVKLTTLPANTTSYVDNTLFAHTAYFYRVVAKNISGNSGNSNQVTFVSANSTPELNGVTDVIIRHSDTFSMPLTSVDGDGDLIIIGSNNLPSFAQIFDYADGTGEIFMTPAPADTVQGLFSGIQVFAKDQFGGIVTKTFSVRVNNNHPPVIADPGAISIKESYKSIVNIVATDGDGDALAWNMESIPAFIIPTINGNTVQLRIQPGLSDAGTYNLSFSVTDPTNSVATRVVPVTVTNFNPNFTTFVNVRQNDGDISTVASAPWNNYSHGVGTLALNNESGAATGFSITLAGGAWQSAKSGKIPGVYPNPVNQSYMYFQGTTAADSRTITITGLNPDGKYNIRILSSRQNDPTNNRTGIFTIGSVTQSIQANDNANTLLSFTSVTPNASGQIVTTVKADQGGAGLKYALVNAVVIESYFDDISAPDAPTSLAVNIVNTQVRLSWVDNSINEQSFEVHRSDDNVNFTKIATTLPDVTTYTDLTVISGQTYYYKVLAANSIGGSAFSNVVTVVGPNHAPIVTPMGQIIVGEDDMQWVEIDATDADGDALVFDLVDAPPFTWLSQIDDNSTLMALAPFPGDAGEYHFQISCTDINGATSFGDLSVFIGQPGETSVKINFTAAGITAASPWNNVTGLNANTVIANLRDQNNAATPMSMTLVTSWQGTNNQGYTSGNNSGIYPDNVLRTSYYMENSTARTVLMGGLNPAKAYDFTFFASRTGVADQRNTNYTIGLKTVVLDAANNQSNTVKITNVRPNASGQVTVSMVRGAGNGTFGYVGSMILREYNPSNTPVPPADPASLAAVATTRADIRLNWVDASGDETGFEIYRSVGNNTAYSLVTTVAANITTYTNSLLTNGTTYFYKVRAINAVGASGYSNEASALTFNYSVSINYNSSGRTQSGWANLSAWNANDGWVPTNPTNQGGAGLSLIDDKGVATGISMTVVKAFGGTNPAGMQVSNGVVPLNVMAQSWFVDKGNSAILKFGNLSLLKKYNFAFFGSRDDTNDPAPRITIYTIGSTSVQLDCSKNTQNLAVIKDVVPGADGTITVTVSAPFASAYGYLNGLIIQAIPNPNARIAADEETIASLIEANEVQAFPNPFADRLTLKFTKGGRFQAKMLSINGTSAFHGEIEAEDGQEVELPVDSNLAAGIYILNVVESSGASQTIKLLKK